MCCLKPLPLFCALDPTADAQHCTPISPSEQSCVGRQLGNCGGVHSIPDVKQTLSALFCSGGWGEQQVPKSARGTEGAHLAVFREQVHFNSRDKQQCPQTQLPPVFFSSSPGCPALLCSCQSLPGMKPLGLNSLALAFGSRFCHSVLSCPYK